MLRLPFLFLRQTLNLGYTHIMIKIDQMDRLVGVFLIVMAAASFATSPIFAVIILGKSEYKTARVRIQ